MANLLPKYLLLAVSLASNADKLPEPRTYNDKAHLDRMAARWVSAYPGALILRLCRTPDMGFSLDDADTEFYLRQVRQEFDWKVIAEKPDHIEDADDGDDPIARTYLGSILTLYPSGKYYTPWARTNVSLSEATLDTCYRDALDKLAQEFDGWIEEGDDDPLDIFFCKRMRQSVESP